MNIIRTQNLCKTYKRFEKEAGLRGNFIAGLLKSAQYQTLTSYMTVRLSSCLKHISFRKKSLYNLRARLQSPCLTASQYLNRIRTKRS